MARHCRESQAFRWSRGSNLGFFMADPRHSVNGMMECEADGPALPPCHAPPPAGTAARCSMHARIGDRPPWHAISHCISDPGHGRCLLHQHRGRRAWLSGQLAALAWRNQNRRPGSALLHDSIGICVAWHHQRLDGPCPGCSTSIWQLPGATVWDPRRMPGTTACACLTCRQNPRWDFI